MREMTPAELYCWYEKGQWPCGHGTKYIPGPRGGRSRNVICPKCDMKINVIDPEIGLQMPFGQVIHEPLGYKPPPMPSPWRERLRNVLEAIRAF